MTSVAAPAETSLSAEEAVTDRLCRALAVLRVVVTFNLVGLTWYRFDNFTRPTVAAAVVVGLIAWTGVAIWRYRLPSTRTSGLLIADLAIAMGALALTPTVKGESFNASLPGFWVMGVLLAWAVVWHVAGGFVAAVLLSTLDLVMRPEITQTNYGNVFLLLLGGPVVGYMAQSLVRMAGQRDAAERRAAIASERARLARAVHDGVLQVLALVQREAHQPQPEFVELGRLAGEQERRLRELIADQASLPLQDQPGHADLMRGLRSIPTGKLRVSLAGPEQVWIDGHQAAELTAVVKACLDNVERHVGFDATAWIFVDDTGGEVVVSVRDDGPGIAPGRLAEAVAQGRLGVSQSIQGRIADLGGQAELATGAEGTEWEFTVSHVASSTR